jgi:hypothetical protein
MYSVRMWHGFVPDFPGIPPGLPWCRRPTEKHYEREGIQAVSEVMGVDTFTLNGDKT